MANSIKRGESLFIPFKNGESIYDSQLKPRMYKTKEQYDKFVYHFQDAEMVEYAEVVRCKDCKKAKEATLCDFICTRDEVMIPMNADDFCSYGERREGE